LLRVNQSEHTSTADRDVNHTTSISWFSSCSCKCCQSSANQSQRVDLPGSNDNQVSIQIIDFTYPDHLSIKVQSSKLEFMHLRFFTIVNDFNVHQLCYDYGYYNIPGSLVMSRQYIESNINVNTEVYARKQTLSSLYSSETMKSHILLRHTRTHVVNVSTTMALHTELQNSFRLAIYIPCYILLYHVTE